MTSTIVVMVGYKSYGITAHIGEDEMCDSEVVG